MTTQIFSAGRAFPIENVGTIAWPIGFYSGPDGSLDGNFSNFEEFSKHYDTIQWIPHYTIPDGGRGNDIDLEITLDNPYRDHGWEIVDYYIDLCKLYLDVNIDGEKARINQMSLPQSLIRSLKETMLKLDSSHLHIYYGCDIIEGDDPRIIQISFGECSPILYPDTFIAELARDLSQTSIIS